VKASRQISEEDFIKRNSAIYEGIEIQNMTTAIISYNEERNVVQYQSQTACLRLLQGISVLIMRRIS